MSGTNGREPRAPLPKPEILAAVRALSLEFDHEEGGEHVFRVPWRADATPSLRINPEKQAWFDNPTGEGGDSWSLIERARNCTFKEAVMFAREHRLIPDEPMRAHDGRSKEDSGAPSKNWIWKTPDAALDAFQRLPLARDNAEAAAMLRDHYGFKDTTAIPDAVRVFIHPKLGPGLVYRGENPEGAPVFKYRSFRRDAKGKRSSRTMHGRDGAMILTGESTPTYPAPPNAPLVVVSGEEKALAAWLFGDSVLSPFSGEGNGSKTWAKWIARRLAQGIFPRVIVANDADETGRRSVKVWARALRGAGVPADRIHAVAWPDDAPKGWDLCDMQREEGDEVFRAFLAAAPVVLVQEPSGARSDSCVLDPNYPRDIARAFLEERYAHPEFPSLLFHRDEFHSWRNRRWERVGVDDMKRELAAWLETKDEPHVEPIRFKVNSKRLHEIESALRAVCGLPSHVDPPTWLERDAATGETRVSGRPTADLVVFRNGIHDVGSDQLLASTPYFFSPHSFDFDFQPDTAPPERFLRFLSELWPDDPDSIATLQEFMGLSMVPDTSFQKILLVIGPRRAGKGVIANVWRKLVRNTAAPSLGSLAANFGLAPLVDAPLAIISDARLGHRLDESLIVERLLDISGEDAVTIDRKFLTQLTLRLPTRIVVMSNEVPRLGDASCALAGRFVVLRLTRSFHGREDLGLADELAREIPWIAVWALKGLKRLRKQKRFLQPETGTQLLKVVEELASPISSFLADRCEIAPDKRIECDSLYGAWCDWCERNRQRPGSAQTFGRDLHAVVPELRKERPRSEDGRRPWFYSGVWLR